MFNIKVHKQYDNTSAASCEVPAVIKQKLLGRKNALKSKLESMTTVDAELTAEENRWLARSYPVLAILAPVMSTHEEKIEFPGDPMCLYGALSVAMDRPCRRVNADLAKALHIMISVRSGGNICLCNTGRQ